MKEILVLYSYRNHKAGYIEMLFDRLSAVAQNSGLALTRGALKDMEFTIRDGKLSITESLSERSLDSFDAVYFEMWYKAPQQALVTATYLQKKNIPFISHDLLGIMAETKLGELGILADTTVPIPDSYISSRRMTLKRFKNKDLQPFNYPLVMKSIDGYGGNNNFLVNSYGDIKDIYKSCPDTVFVLQPFIPNTHDYRCIVLGGEIKVVLKRQRTNESHLNNTSQGAEGTIVPLDEIPPEAQASVLESARLLSRSDFAGVDLLFNSENGQHYILEVNQTPQIEIGAHIDVKMQAMTDFLKEIAK